MFMSPDHRPTIPNIRMQSSTASLEEERIVSESTVIFPLKLPTIKPIKIIKHQIEFIIINTPKSLYYKIFKKNEKNSKKHLQFIKSGGIVLLVAEENTANKICGCSSMVELQPSKLITWVRFPSPAWYLFKDIFERIYPFFHFTGKNYKQ